MGQSLGQGAKAEPGIDLVDMSVHFQEINLVPEMVSVSFRAVREKMHATVLTGLVKLHHHKTDYLK